MAVTFLRCVTCINSGRGNMVLFSAASNCCNEYGRSIGGRSFEPAAIILLCIWLSVEDVLTGVDMMND
ncbi:hypothetical protein Tco_0478597 [Tanacetum coccineum]